VAVVVAEAAEAIQAEIEAATAAALAEAQGKADSQHLQQMNEIVDGRRSVSPKEQLLVGREAEDSMVVRQVAESSEMDFQEAVDVHCLAHPQSAVRARVLGAARLASSSEQFWLRGAVQLAVQVLAIASERIATCLGTKLSCGSVEHHRDPSSVAGTRARLGGCMPTRARVPAIVS